MLTLTRPFTCGHEMTFVACACCGQAEGYEAIWDIPDNLWFPHCYFHLVRCEHCGFIYLNPQPDDREMTKHYPGFHYASVQFPQALPPAYSWRFSQIERRQKKGRLLEVGCGEGFFLTFALQRGWEGYGLDTSPEAIQAAKKRLSDRVAASTLLDASYQSDSFDVVSLFEVLEHLPDLMGHLREIRRVLKPGGWVCLSVPNFASLERRIFGKWWVGLDAPRHLQQFTPKSLRFVLEAAEFEVVELRSVNADNIQISKRAITYCQESLRYWLRSLGLYPEHVPPTAEQFSEEKTEKRPFLKRGIRVLEWIVFYPLCAFARSIDRENTLWAVARKS